MSSEKQVTAEEFDRIFDEGEESILPYLDVSKAQRINAPSKRISMDMNPDMVRSLDREAKRLGVNRQAVIKFACDGYLAQVGMRERTLVEA